MVRGRRGVQASWEGWEGWEGWADEEKADRRRYAGSGSAIRRVCAADSMQLPPNLISKMPQRAAAAGRDTATACETEGSPLARALSRPDELE